MTNRIAVSLGLPDTASCLDTLGRLASRVGLAEIRLDLMRDYDLRRLIADSPVPLIVTCRAAREGGSFGGSEAERLAILCEALALGCAYVDVEWDSLDALAAEGVPARQIIASRHWYDQMPADLDAFYQRLRSGAQVVKLVGYARQPADLLPALQLLRDATSPVIVIAMGESGQLSRILAPHFPACFLTYGTADATQSTAAGQLSIAELYELYQLQHVGPHTAIVLHLCATADVAQAVRSQNQGGPAGAALHVPLAISAADVAALLPALRRLLPQLTLVAEPDLPADVAAALAALPSSPDAA